MLNCFIFVHIVIITIIIIEHLIVKQSIQKSKKKYTKCSLQRYF